MVLRTLEKGCAVEMVLCTLFGFAVKELNMFFIKTNFMIQRFEDLHIWQLAREMVVEVYKIFESNRDYDFKSQIQRASI